MAKKIEKTNAARLLDKAGHIVCVVPGDMEVDLKALAKASGNKKVVEYVDYNWKSLQRN